MNIFLKRYPKFKNVFKFQQFNSVQLGCYNQIIDNQYNALVSAPTSSGKTVIFQLAIIKQSSLKPLKCLYLAPIKSLCHQKFTVWTQKFYKIFSVSELTSDTVDSQQLDLSSIEILISTPEKIDFLSRKSLSYLASINLLLVDEIHMLNLEDRGGILEALISRIMSINNPRILAVSATIPNIQQISEWLKVPKQNTRVFGEQYRPVPVKKVVLGFKSSNNPFLFEKTLNYKLLQVIRNYNDEKSSLVFCQTQKGTQSACQQIITDMKQRQFIDNDQVLLSLIQVSKSISNSTLQVMVAQGVGFHNASLTLSDRILIQKLFLERKLKVLCTTSTLAMGINLPARLVVIKSTQCYRGSGKGYQEYTQIQIQQMLGRAGRPPFDKEGTAVIMTQSRNYNKYLNANKLQTLQSHLNERLSEHINAQIFLKSISCFQDVVKYFKNSFCYIRMKKSPAFYGIKGNIDVQVEKMCQQSITKLKESDLISYNNENKKIVPRTLGINIAKNSVQINTIVNIMNQIPSVKSEKDFIMLLCTSEQIKKYRNKLDERKLLKQINEKVKYSLKCAISTPQKKAYILLQAALDGVTIDNWQMRKQVKQMEYFLKRLCFCLKSACSEKKIFWGHFWSCQYQKFWWLKFNIRNQSMTIKQFSQLNEKWKALSMRGFKNMNQIIDNIQNIDCLGPRNTHNNIIKKLMNLRQSIQLKYEPQHNRGLLTIKFTGQFDDRLKSLTVVVASQQNEIYTIRYLNKQQKQTIVSILKKQYYCTIFKQGYIGFDQLMLIKQNGEIIHKSFDDFIIKNQRQHKINKNERKSVQASYIYHSQSYTNPRSKSNQVYNKKKQKNKEDLQVKYGNKAEKKANGNSLLTYNSRKRAPSPIKLQQKQQEEHTTKKGFIPLNQYKCWKPGFPSFTNQEDNRQTISRKLQIQQEQESKKLPPQRQKPKIQQLTNPYEYFYDLFK